MTEAIKLRPAALADARRLAQLWAITFPDKFKLALGKKAEVVLYDWLRLSQRHLQTTTVAEIDELIVGFIVLETPGAPPVDDGRWLWHALQLNNGLLGALRGLLIMLLIDDHRRLGADEVYIEMLGVDPAWRGQGVARQLILHAETVADAHHTGRLTLNVMSDNRPAIHLYQKMGFKKAKPEKENLLLKWVTGHSGYYEMAKQLR